MARLKEASADTNKTYQNMSTLASVPQCVVDSLVLLCLLSVPVKWTAPEAMVKRQYSRASDVFSYGVV